MFLLSLPGIDVNLTTGCGDTALKAAAINNRKEIVRELLKRSDIRPDIKNCWGETPRYEALFEGHMEIAKMIEEKERGGSGRGADGGETDTNRDGAGVDIRGGAASSGRI